MKTTMRVKVVIETDKYQNYNDVGNLPPLSLATLKKEINKGGSSMEWINDNLSANPEETLIIKF
jgi:hypothetical protein